MKTIGLIGGMSWESTVTYYQVVNRFVASRLGGLHSARVAMHSVEFHELQELQHEGRWQEVGTLLAAAARSVARAGADFLVLCTNTMHIVAPQIEAAVDLPLLHIADATAEHARERGVSKVGLLGTRFTMEEDFYKGRLHEQHGLEVVVPEEHDRAVVHRVIYEELCQGQVEAASRAEFQRIVGAMQRAGAGGVVLGCTEIGLLLRPEDAEVPLFDTARLHAEAAARLALEPKAY